MKICVIGPAHPFRGGIAHHTNLICSKLAERHEVDAITFKRLYPSFLFPGKSQIDPSPKPRKFNPFALIDSMNPVTWVDAGRFARDLQADLTLIQWWHPFFGPCLGKIASKAKANSKIVFICHNAIPHEKTPFSMKLTKSCLKHADGFITHSEQDKKDLQSILPKMPSENIRKTILPESHVFPVTGMSKDEARKKIGVNGQVILFFGLVRQYKGLMTLIEAMPLLKNRNIKCLVVGEFYDSKEKYTAKIKDLKLDARISILDRYIPNEEVEPFFAAADAAVLPYQSATQSGIALLAFRYGKPVIASNVGGLPEIIDDGRTGLLIPPNDPPALADAIDRYFQENLEASFTREIYAQKNRFSWERVIDTIETMEKIL